VSCNRGIFLGRFFKRNRSDSQLGMVSAAFGIPGEDSRTRASLRKELKVSIRSDVPALDPDRTGTGGFDSPHQPVPGAGFVVTLTV
jgi:hypothetical protein